MKALKILVVEDQESLMECIQTILASEGHKVDCAYNGLEACKKLETHSYDLILSDIQMPQLTGIELFEWVRQHKSTPFIFMTGYSEILSIEKALEAGAIGFISKPFDREELLEYIQAIMSAYNPGEAKDNDYVSVSSDGFVPTYTYPFHLYMKNKNGALIKINHCNQKMDAGLIRRINDIELGHICLFRSVLAKYYEVTFMLWDSLMGNKAVSKDRLARFFASFALCMYQDSRFSEENKHHLGEVLTRLREQNYAIYSQVKLLSLEQSHDFYDWLFSYEKGSRDAS